MHASISRQRPAASPFMIALLLLSGLGLTSSALAHEACANESRTKESLAKEGRPKEATPVVGSSTIKAGSPAASTSKLSAKSPRIDLGTPPGIAGMSSYATAALAVPTGIAEDVEIQIPFEGRLETIRLFRTSMRSADARLLVDHGNGKIVEEPLPPHRTYRGSLASTGESVAASIVDGRLTAMIPLADDTLWVQPSSDFFPGRPANEHVVYRRSSLTPIGDHRCGVDEAKLAQPDWMAGIPNDPAESNGSVAGGDSGGGQGDGSGDGNGDGGVAGTNPFIARIAFDTDFEFFQKNGSNVANTINDIETVMNNVTLVYDRDVNITYEYSGFVVRASSADPYTSSVMTDLLCEFRTKWNALPESEILRDVAQIFTGKTIQGSTIGLAWLGVVCNQVGTDCSVGGNLAYSAVESRFSGIADFRTSLSAHEIGHNWQAQHCDAAAPCNIMCSVINGCQGTTGANLKFTAGEQNQIINYRNAVGCDVALPSPLTIPFLDNFESPAINQLTWIFNKGGTITTAALNEPSPTRSLNLNSTSANEYADDEIRSNFFQLGGQSVGIVGYFVQRNGVESGEQLVVEYFNNLLKWQTLNTITSDGINQSTFTEFSHNLPANALHNKFRLRFRTLGDQTDDNWYIDNVSVVAVVIPANDECVNATPVGTGTVSFNNTNATNSATSLPASCSGSVGTTMQKDIWYLFTAPCTGNAKVSTCGTTAFDSRLAVYASACPTGGALVGCNNDDAQCTSGAASVTFPAGAGASYYIRVGANSTGGAGTLTITCTAVLPCPADLSEDRIVDATDLAFLLGAWGTSGADVNSDGNTDANDLAILLGAWGNCP